MHLGDADASRDLRLGQPLEEAQLDDRPLSLVERREPRLEQRAVLHLVVAGIRPAEEILDGAFVVLAEPQRLGEDLVEYAWYVSRASTTSSSSSSATSASSEIVGERPRSAVRVSIARVSLRLSSFIRLGTWTAQARSRKWRWISPTIVGTAYVVNFTPRSTSKRSIASTSPIEPTWMRSSSGSPRPA